jgi:hypothetical protein
MRRIIASLVFATITIGITTADAVGAPVVIPSGVGQSQIPADCITAFQNVAAGSTCQISAPPSMIEAGLQQITCGSSSCTAPACRPTFEVLIACITSQSGVVTTSWWAPCSVLPAFHQCPTGAVCRGPSQFGSFSGICG